MVSNLPQWTREWLAQLVCRKHKPAVSHRMEEKAIKKLFAVSSLFIFEFLLIFLSEEHIHVCYIRRLRTSERFVKTLFALHH